VRENDVEGVRTYIALGKDLNMTDKLQRTAVHLAAWSGNVEILQMLIRAKADFSKKAMDAFTILHFAVTSSSPRAVECIEFIGKKARSIIHQRTTKGLKSALHLAIPKGRTDVIQALLEIGLDPLAKNSQGCTGVDLARQQKVPAVYEIVASFAEARGNHSTDTATAENDDEESDINEKKEESESVLGKRSFSTIETSASRIEEASDVPHKK
jgi:ankyrin repeat protein